MKVLVVVLVGAVLLGGMYGAAAKPARAPRGSVRGAYDPAMAGCQVSSSCATRIAYRERDLRAQPGVRDGQLVRCPVSGAVFRIHEGTPSRDARGKTLYFCCPACAAWFTEHEAEVLAKRGIA